MEKKEVIEWSGGSPLVKVLDSWKHYPIHDFESDFILTMRMRGYAMGKDSERKYPDGSVDKIKKEDLQFHIVFFPTIKKFRVFQPV